MYFLTVAELVLPMVLVYSVGPGKTLEGEEGDQVHRVYHRLEPGTLLTLGEAGSLG